jgi:hypothetical protein
MPTIDRPIMATPRSIFNVDSHGLNANRMLIRQAERRRAINAFLQMGKLSLPVQTKIYTSLDC